MSNLSNEEIIKWFIEPKKNSKFDIKNHKDIKKPVKLLLYIRLKLLYGLLVRGNLHLYLPSNL